MCEDSCGGVQRSGALQEKNESRRSATFELCAAVKWNATTGRSLRICVYDTLCKLHIGSLLFFQKQVLLIEANMCSILCLSHLNNTRITFS